LALSDHCRDALSLAADFETAPLQTAANRWDYLIVTASSEAQAAAYEAQLRLRRKLGLLVGGREVMVVADPGGRRVGSGGSTIHCITQVLCRELALTGRALPKDSAPQPEMLGREHSAASTALGDPTAWQEVLQRLRILIVHAGGDSRRLPAYGPCGKAFVPVPGESDSAVPVTLFDRQLPTYLALPPSERGRGQVVITSGDVLLKFDPRNVRFAAEGVTGLGCHVSPEQATRHGVYCADSDGRVRLFLQKASPEEQEERGAVDRYGQSILDIGVLSFDAAMAVALLKMVGASPDGVGRLVWTGPMADALMAHGLDFYREICCALGREATFDYYLEAVHASGSELDEPLLRRIYDAVSPIPFSVQVLPRCGFMHFGATEQIISSGLDLLRQDRGVSDLETCVGINNRLLNGAAIVGANAWVEGCRLRSSLSLGGKNVVVGVDIDEPLALPPEACLDVIPGHSRNGRDVWFVRCYGVGDTFKRTAEQGATFCGRPIAEWLRAVGARPEDVWDGDIPSDQKTLWNARVFPAEDGPTAYRRWLWMFEPEAASDTQRRAWLAADRYSPAEIAKLADQEAFHNRRTMLRAQEIRRSLRWMFCNTSGFSAAELAYLLEQAQDRAAWVADVLEEARYHFDNGGGSPSSGFFVLSRILHTLSSAVARLAETNEATLKQVVPRLKDALRPEQREWLENLGLCPDEGTTVGEWCGRLHRLAFRHFGRRIVASGDRGAILLTSALRSDEIVWGRAPARLDVGGGWADTPPYSLEHGGCVINAAVDLNGQPPIQAYARVIDQPIVRIGSIDLGRRLEISDLESLLDYRSPHAEFSLVKAALALSGLSPEVGDWPEGVTLQQILERFGGGIELTTLAAIPKGSGLGTSSIMGAVILAVIHRVMGHEITRRELFHKVLRVEQALTTGGGWQDQIGGVVGGVKLIRAEPGLVPDPAIHFVPADVLDPKANAGQTLLYYTGITRLAKDILGQVVGRYLDRDRIAMATLRSIHALPTQVADAMARKDLPEFGRLVDVAWELNKRLDPNSTTEEVEAILDRIRPHVHGAKLLGAGGGGFLLMVCKSPQDAAAVREMLEAEPPNERARFFDFNISREGLVVTVC